MNRASLLAAASGALLAAMPAFAQSAMSTASGMATATIVRPIAVRQISDLDFGLVTSTGEAGSVTLQPGAPAARYSGSARLGCAADDECPVPHVSSFEVTGEANRSYTIAVPASVAITGETLSADRESRMTAPPAVLRVEAIRLRSASRPEAGPAGRLDPGGRDRFDLGATLRIAGAVAPARYRVSIPVLVTYH